ncbi:hypothetical protein CJ030_MR0G007796 [Morella rubra]|uniref:DUF7806 domain-containing protein n=1 Tax=Morella rubra TaxID=262757 RepID=A0A6A1UJ41_9ROSI|nr:hypothetical protein CJ030_MR0G007796 [Morella rubra]
MESPLYWTRDYNLKAEECSHRNRSCNLSDGEEASNVPLEISRILSTSVKEDCGLECSFRRVEKLRKLQQEGVFFSSKDDGKDNGQLNMPRGEQVISEVSNSSSRKRSRLSVSSSQDNAMQRESGKKLSKETVCISAFANFQQPECCRRTIGTSGDGLDERVSASCLFQAFVEYLMDMKLSAVNQTEGWSISALHQSSGFSFSLTWMNEAAGEDVELLYRVSSLGTFERVAPEWMKEAIIFSTRMCPIFFERVSRVIKLPH